MRQVFQAAATLGALLMLGGGANAQATGTGVQGSGANASASQTAFSTQSIVTTIRRAGNGPGGFTQLCDDPLDPRAVTNECTAAGIGQ